MGGDPQQSFPRQQNPGGPETPPQPTSDPHSLFKVLELLNDIDVSQQELQRQTQWGVPRWRPWFDMIPKDNART